MKSVAVLGFDLALSSDITGVMDLFNMSGVTWNRVHEKPKENRFDMKLISVDGNPINCIGDMKLCVHGSIDEVDKPDLILIPTIAGNPEKTLRLNHAAIPWLKDQCEKGVDIAASSIGVYFLAEAGILDGIDATTHWGFADEFQQRYPRVNLKPEQLITAEGNVFCSGGTVAWTDLCLLLMERYYGAEYVSETVASAVMHSRCSPELAYNLARGKKYHQDEGVLAAQNWMEENYTQAINLTQLADKFNMSSRTFKRRFKAATGESPLNYLQALRIEEAKKYLETTTDSIEIIGNAIGYDDLAYFSRLFKRESGMSPSAYRKKFRRS